MNNLKNNPIEKAKTKLQKIVNRPFNWLIYKLTPKLGKGKAEKIVMAIIVILKIFITFISFVAVVISIISFIPKHSEKSVPVLKNPSLTPESSVQGVETKSMLEAERVKTINKAPCSGNSVTIIEDFIDALGKEKLLNKDENDLAVVSAPDNGQFQGTKKYPFECQIPWIATVSAIPRKSDSIGLFLEFEEVFKIIIGDGDRLTWKVEKNDNGRREAWTQINKQKLDNGKISIDRQFIFSIKALRNKNAVDLEFSLNYVPEGKTNYIWESHQIFNIRPEAINLDVNPAHNFRIGINDWRFKGKGSELKLGTFSVKTP